MRNLIFVSLTFNNIYKKPLVDVLQNRPLACNVVKKRLWYGFFSESCNIFKKILFYRAPPEDYYLIFTYILCLLVQTTSKDLPWLGKAQSSFKVKNTIILGPPFFQIIESSLSYRQNYLCTNYCVSCSHFSYVLLNLLK